MLLSAGDIIKRSLGLYQENAKLFLTYMSLLALPSLLSLAVALVFAATAPEPGNGWAAGGVLLGSIVFSLGNLWLSLAFLPVVAARYNGQDPGTLKMRLTKSTRHILPAIGLSVVTLLILLGGFFLLIVPGIIFLIWFAFSMYFLVLEDTGIVDSLKKSKALVQGRLGAVLWRLIAPGVVFALLYIVVEGVIQWISSLVISGMNPNSALGITLLIALAVLAIVLSVLITPLSVTAPTILYLELKKK